MAGLMYSAVHGLIDLELGGRLRDNKELSKPEEIVELLFALVRAHSARTIDPALEYC